MPSPPVPPSAPAEHSDSHHDHDHHGHSHTHGHTHSHTHGHAHDHAPMGARTGTGATWSLLGLSVLQRVMGALVVIALIWASVYLVLDA